VGVALPPTLRHAATVKVVPRIAEAAEVAVPIQNSVGVESVDHHPTFKSKWSFAEASRSRRGRSSVDSLSSTSTDIKLRDLKTHLEDTPEGPEDAEPDTPSKMGFFDVGGLVDRPPNESPNSRSRQASIQAATRRLSQQHSGQRSSSKAFLSDIGGLLSRQSHMREEDEIHSPSTFSPRKTSSPGRSPMRSDKRKILRNRRLPSQQEDDEVPIRPRLSGPDDLSFSDAGGCCGDIIEQLKSCYACYCLSIFTWKLESKRLVSDFGIGFELTCAYTIERRRWRI